MKPDESLFKSHLEEAPFLAGCDAGRWGLFGGIKDIIWPHAILWVGADKMIVPAGKIHLRFNGEGYPTAAPTSCPWDVGKNTRLENSQYPKLTGKFAKVFRLDWMGGAALYAPVDRSAMAGHVQWQQQFPAWWWQAHFTVVKYLEFVNRCLNPIKDENQQT